MNVRVLNPLRIVVLGAALLSVAPAALAAGDHAGGHGHATDIGEPGQAAQASRTIEITMHDNYYEPERVEVRKGETVRFIVRNEGELVHEFNIATAEMHAAHQEEMKMMVEHGVIDGDHINHDMMKMDMGGGRTMEHHAEDPSRVLWVSLDDNSLGYDIRNTGSTPDRCIEVKGSQGSDIRFFLSSNEWCIGHELGDAYEIQFWGGISLTRTRLEEYGLLRMARYPRVFRNLGKAIGAGDLLASPSQYLVTAGAASDPPK